MKIAIIGYGKMGKTIEKIAIKEKIEIVCIIDKEVKEGDLSKADVSINFCVPSAAVANIIKSFDYKVPVVCGTTGWLNDFDLVKKYCEKMETAFIYSSNFSFGVNIFFKVNQYLASLMNKYDSPYNISIKETHHKEKLDSPSGTAISLANDIIKKNNSFKSWTKNKNSKGISMISKRQNKKIGVHNISFESKFDKIKIQHEALSRDAFAKGSLIAAKWIKNKKGIFKMDDILDF
tara:strand:- start:273 stop:974 length:702 start_codon:yes stop_codon:yes gene_type:complete